MWRCSATNIKENCQFHEAHAITGQDGFLYCLNCTGLRSFQRSHFFNNHAVLLHASSQIKLLLLKVGFASIRSFFQDGFFFNWLTACARLCSFQRTMRWNFFWSNQTFAFESGFCALGWSWMIFLVQWYHKLPDPHSIKVLFSSSSFFLFFFYLLENRIMLVAGEFMADLISPSYLLFFIIHIMLLHPFFFRCLNAF